MKGSEEITKMEDAKEEMHEEVVSTDPKKRKVQSIIGH